MTNVNESLKTLNSQINSIKEYCIVLDKTLLVHKLDEVEQQLALLEVSLQNS